MKQQTQEHKMAQTNGTAVERMAAAISRAKGFIRLDEERAQEFLPWEEMAKRMATAALAALIEGMTDDELGEMIYELYQKSHCNYPAAIRAALRTLLPAAEDERVAVVKAWCDRLRVIPCVPSIADLLAELDKLAKAKG